MGAKLLAAGWPGALLLIAGLCAALAALWLAWDRPRWRGWVGPALAMALLALGASVVLNFLAPALTPANVRTALGAAGAPACLLAALLHRRQSPSRAGRGWTLALAWLAFLSIAGLWARILMG